MDFRSFHGRRVIVGAYYTPVGTEGDGGGFSAPLPLAPIYVPKTPAPFGYVFDDANGNRWTIAKLNSGPIAGIDEWRGYCAACAGGSGVTYSSTTEQGILEQIKAFADLAKAPIFESETPGESVSLSSDGGYAPIAAPAPYSPSAPTNPAPTSPAPTYAPQTGSGNSGTSVPLTPTPLSMLPDGGETPTWIKVGVAAALGLAAVAILKK